MIILIYGSSGSGKSVFAENLVSTFKTKKNYYVATMNPSKDSETQLRIARHKLQREGKGFETIECPFNMEKLSFTSEDTVLIECLSNLVANEYFMNKRPNFSSSFLKFIKDSKAKNILIVTNNLFEDGNVYDKETTNYLCTLAKLNKELASISTHVYEVVYGIEQLLKGENSCYKL